MDDNNLFSRRIQKMNDREKCGNENRCGYGGKCLTNQAEDCSSEQGFFDKRNGDGRQKYWAAAGAMEEDLSIHRPRAREGRLPKRTLCTRRSEIRRASGLFAADFCADQDSGVAAVRSIAGAGSEAERRKLRRID